jgi:hypothetical protein
VNATANVTKLRIIRKLFCDGHEGRRCDVVADYLGERWTAFGVGRTDDAAEKAAMRTLVPRDIRRSR